MALGHERAQGLDVLGRRQNDTLKGSHVGWGFGMPIDAAFNWFATRPPKIDAHSPRIHRPQLYGSQLLLGLNSRSVSLGNMAAVAATFVHIKPSEIEVDPSGFVGFGAAWGVPLAGQVDLV